MKLSIVTIAFNSENEIEETLKSCISIKDKFPSTEYIIIDGKSTDRTLDIISKYQINIDKILSESDDVGIYDAFNKGMDLSIGEYIIFMNSGDTFHDQFDISNFFQILILKMR